ncbi:MAG: hypothetical protein LQ341_007833, partial [Variospora aurantia]
LGCGRSTHLAPASLPVPAAEFFTPALFLSELDNLLSYFTIRDNYSLLGQSWGGMLAAEHAVGQPTGLKNLIIANSPADMGSWMAAAERLRGQLPEDVQEVLGRCERESKEDSEEYETAMMAFYERHVCRVKPMPAELAESLQALKEEGTVYATIHVQTSTNPNQIPLIYPGTALPNSPSPEPSTWDIRPEIHKIKAPTLLLNGKYDEAQDEVVEPYFWAIDKVKWYRFAESSHTPQLEEREEFVSVVAGFLLAP